MAVGFRRKRGDDYSLIPPLEITVDCKHVRGGSALKGNVFSREDPRGRRFMGRIIVWRNHSSQGG
ncbi:MAG: hypothetical protein QW506_01685 [Thermoproteota archaeon]